MRQLKAQGYNQVIVANDVDLRVQMETFHWFKDWQPEYVFLAAAKVGGIGYNKAVPAEFIADNLTIQTNVISAAEEFKAKKLCFLGTACIYPKHAPVPIKEEYLMTGPLEETNSAYAVAKIAGITMCQAFTKQYGFNTISVMPNNLYGIHDNFREEESHVIPAMIRKFLYHKEHDLPSIEFFGTGTPTREFLFADDLADGLIYLMNNYDDPSIINIGPNYECSIKELAYIIAELVRYGGVIKWDATKPDGTPRRALDTSKMDALGWKSKTSLENGLRQTIDWYLANRDNGARI
jgi:GDP-L-fucose synthase